jgi:hypothetical protein
MELVASCSLSERNIFVIASILLHKKHKGAERMIIYNYHKNVTNCSCETTYNTSYGNKQMLKTHQREEYLSTISTYVLEGTSTKNCIINLLATD